MKYFYRGKFNPDKLPKLNIDRQSVSLIPENSRVLEIGCADGFMGEYLTKEKGCRVVGVEIDKEAVEKAKEKGLVVIQGNIEEEMTLNKLKTKEKFKIILCSSLIEHLVDPLKALKEWRGLLERDGNLIITTPNICHWSARLKILSGKFPSEEYGIFDKSHLHFFTASTLIKMLNDSEYVVEHICIDSVGGGLPKLSRFLSLFFPSLFAYQILVKAKVLADQKSQ